MEAIVPWSALCEVIEPHYPKAGNGRPPIGLERMLRIHFIQHWFNLADLACEEALYDSASLRRFVGIDLGREPVPDSTTITEVSQTAQRQQVGRGAVCQVGQELQARGFKVNTGTIVDATIIGAPSSTKNADKARDPEMHQTRKGQQWYFGMKLHIGVDSQSGLAHSAVVTAANVHDKHPLPDLLHGNEQRVYGDSAYASQKALIASKAPKPKTSPTSAPATRGSLMRLCVPRTATSQKSVHGWSMSLAWSSACGDSTRCVTAVCRRTPRGRSRHWRWPTFTSAAKG
jgi:IS5 family transposase